MEIVEIYIHLLDLTTNRSEKCNLSSLAGIEPAALRFRCSALTNWATDYRGQLPSLNANHSELFLLVYASLKIFVFHQLMMFTGLQTLKLLTIWSILR